MPLPQDTPLLCPPDGNTDALCVALVPAVLEPLVVVFTGVAINPVEVGPEALVELAAAQAVVLKGLSNSAKQGPVASG